MGKRRKVEPDVEIDSLAEIFNRDGDGVEGSMK